MDPMDIGVMAHMSRYAAQVNRQTPRKLVSCGAEALKQSLHTGESPAQSWTVPTPEMF